MAAFAEFSLIPQYIPGVHFTDKAPTQFLYALDGKPARRIDPSFIPGQAFLDGSRKTVPEFLPISGALAMCKEAYDLIESLEPKTHQFFEVLISRASASKKPIFCRDGRILSEPYYLINPQATIDPIIVEKSGVTLGVAGRVYPRLSMYPPVLTLDKRLIEGHDLWRGQLHFSHNYTFLSDFLSGEILRRKWKGLTITRAAEA
jgi:hypothetical protein